MGGESKAKVDESVDTDGYAAAVQAGGDSLGSEGWGWGWVREFLGAFVGMNGLTLFGIGKRWVRY